MAEMSYAACFGPFGNAKSCEKCSFNGWCDTQQKCGILLAKGWRKAPDVIDELVARIGDSLHDEDVMNTIRAIAEKLKGDL
jgi:hypothetical protein